jgi:hypothetical protein
MDVAFDGFAEINRRQTGDRLQIQLAANGIEELCPDPIGVVCADAATLGPDAKRLGNAAVTRRRPSR